MKRIGLMAVATATLLVPSFVLVGNAGAANPHGTPPGHGGDPNASCGHHSPGKPDDQCNSANLPFSEGCQHGQAPNQNPHCEDEGQPTGKPPGGGPGGGPTGGPTPSGGAGGVAGAQAPGGVDAAENKLAAAAAQGKGGGKLPFTGLETLWLALLGAAMLGSGLALRARSGHSVRRVRTRIGSD
jgi:hypothetical protein